MNNDDDRIDLKKRADDINGAIMNRIHIVERLFLWLKIILIIVGGALATAAGFMSEPPTGDVPWKQIIGVFGALMAMIGGVLVAVVERTAPTELEKARQAVDSAQRYLGERDQVAAQVQALERLDRKRRNLIAAYHTMREVAEQAFHSKFDAKRAITDLFDVSERTLLAAMGYEAGERYSISVYQKKPDSGGAEILVRLVDRRSDRIDERADTREWRIGEGFTGVAWQRNSEVLLSDAQDEKVREAFHVPEDKKRDGDDERYRSVSSLPIRVGTQECQLIWGVLTVTSDKPGRFSPRPDHHAAQNVEAVRALGGIIALIAGYTYVNGVSEEDKS